MLVFFSFCIEIHAEKGEQFLSKNLTFRSVFFFFFFFFWGGGGGGGGIHWANWQDLFYVLWQINSRGAYYKNVIT